MNKILKRTMVALVALITLSLNNAMAQQLKMPTLEELMSGSRAYQAPEIRSKMSAQWWGDLYVYPENNTLKAVNPKTGKEVVLTTLDDINGALTAAGIESLRQLPTGQTPWADQPWMIISMPNRYVVYNWVSKQIVRQTETEKGARSADYHFKSGNVAYTIGNNLHVNGKAISNEPEGVLVGQSVHRNEFGINKGTFWSPKGNLLAFYKMDESMVTEYPLVDIEPRIAEETPVRYPMAGMTSHKVWVGIYNVSTGNVTYLDAGDPTDRYFTNISWAPDEQSLYLIELNRDQNHAQLCRYNAQTGKLEEVVYEETHPKYVEPENALVFLPWDESKFIYQTERDGYNHLYLMDTKARVSPEKKDAAAGGTYTESLKTTQLTQGNWLVQRIVGFNEKNREIIYLSTQESPLQSNLYRVNMSGKVTPVNQDEAVHSSPQLSASGNYVIDRYSTPTQAMVIDLCEINKPEKKQNLVAVGESFPDFIMPQIEVGTIKAADGKTDLYYRICKPADFDPNKKYPAVVYVYGGPHAQNISATMRYAARPWDIYMANKGYIMFCLDNRGSENRGLEFEQATFRHLGVEESKDQAKGAEFLMSLPYVDKDRIGVHGWSFGGHMTTSMMLRYPEIFKVGVAGGPVIDWQYYEVMYGERYMDTPQANPEGYEESNLRNLAGNLKGHLLVIHGYQDETCVPQHTLSFMKACIDARTYPDLFFYPGHKHNMSGRDRIHLHEKITRYFEDYL